jgi:hypothetical protein
MTPRGKSHDKEADGDIAGFTRKSIRATSAPDSSFEIDRAGALAMVEFRWSA